MRMDAATGTLIIGSAPCAPKELADQLNGLVPSEFAGSCGVAAYTGEMVIVEDTLTDPRWAGLRDLAREIEKYACWSIPVFDAEKIVGTFAISRSIQGAPSAADCPVP